MGGGDDFTTALLSTAHAPPPDDDDEVRSHLEDAAGLIICIWVPRNRTKEEKTKLLTDTCFCPYIRDSEGLDPFREYAGSPPIRPPLIMTPSRRGGRSN